MFYLAGIIERWGSGTLNILDWCTENANPAPVWSEQAGSVYVSFLPAVLPTRQGSEKNLQGKERLTPHLTPHVTPHVWKLLTVMKGAEDRDTLQEKLGLKARKNFRLLYLAPSLKDGLIEMTIPDKPRSREQKYRLTAKGKEWLTKYQGEREP